MYKLFVTANPERRIILTIQPLLESNLVQNLDFNGDTGDTLEFEGPPFQIHGTFIIFYQYTNCEKFTSQ